MRKQLLILIFLLLSGCATATAPGMYKETDFVSDQKIIPLNYEDTYRNLKMGFRKCVPPEWLIDDQLYHQDKSAFFDVTIVIYGLGNIARGASYLGKIILTAVDEKSTRVKGQVINSHESHMFSADGSETRGRWFRWASGNLSCEY